MIYKLSGMLCEAYCLFKSVFVGFDLVFAVFLLGNFIGNLAVEVPEKRVDSCLDCLDLFCLFIWDIKPKVFLHRNHQFNRIQRIKSQLFKGSIFS